MSESDVLNDGAAAAELWSKINVQLQISPEESMEMALSGEDIRAALAYVEGLRRALEAGWPIDGELKEFAVAALTRFNPSKHWGKPVTMGQAFGVESGKRGRPTRPVVARYIKDLIKCLKDEHGFPLGESSKNPSAFEVAALLLERFKGYERSPRTMREIWRQ